MNLSGLAHAGLGLSSDDDDPLEDEDEEELGPLFNKEDAEAERKLRKGEIRLSQEALARNKQLGEVLDADPSFLGLDGAGLVDPMTEALSSLRCADVSDHARDADAWPPVEPVGATVEDLLEAWKRGVLAGKDALEDRRWAWNEVLRKDIPRNQERLLDIEDDKTLGKMWKSCSLVQCEEKSREEPGDEKKGQVEEVSYIAVRFVRWTVAGRRGWVVPIEYTEEAWRPRARGTREEMEAQPERPFNPETTIIIHPNTRVNQAALSGSGFGGLRNPISATTIRLKEMWEAAMRSTETPTEDAESAPLQLCGYCGSLQAHGSWPVSTCPLCMLTMHGPCASRLRGPTGALLDSESGAELRPVAQLDVPAPLARLLCRMCQELLARRVDDDDDGDDGDDGGDDDGSGAEGKPAGKAKATAKKTTAKGKKKGAVLAKAKAGGKKNKGKNAKQKANAKAVKAASASSGAGKGAEPAAEEEEKGGEKRDEEGPPEEEVEEEKSESGEESSGSSASSSSD